MLTIESYKFTPKKKYECTYISNECICIEMEYPIILGQAGTLIVISLYTGGEERR